jgi:predicted ATPase/DNA-binding CsgD family transcriptional regulator
MTAYNLPSQPTPFVGREQELVEIATLLATPACRLLTLTGPGGVGKTRLALEIVTRVVGAHGRAPLPSPPFPNGIYFVPLQPLTSPDFLIPTIADALQFSLYGEGDPKTQLLNYLREKHLLLVLDNFEHLLDGADLLSDILDAAPAVKLLVTSRERLHLREEWVLDIGGLPFPEQNADGALDDYSAVRLFVHSARRAGYMPLEADMPAIVQICWLVEGMPLAIELAAAWARVLPCAEIAREIERSLDILATTLRNVPDKHRSMRAVFDYSWNLLSPDAQLALKRLSVFQGGFRREAAEQVAGARLPILAALVDKSLLRVNANGRYDLHELLLHYARERLDSEPIRRLHSAYYAGFLAQRLESLKGAPQLAALQEIEAELENVRAAWNRAVEQREVRHIEQALEPLGLFYELHGHFQEGKQQFASAANALSESSLLSRLLYWQGVFHYHLADYAGAKALHLHSLSLAGGENREAADALRGLGLTLSSLGEHDEAQHTLQSALQLARALGDAWRAANTLIALTFVASRQGEFAAWKQYGQEALRIRQPAGDLIGIAECLSSLGAACNMLGEYEEAKRYFQESVELYRRLNNVMGLAFSLYTLGFLYWTTEAYQEAERVSQESLDIYRQLGVRWGVGWCLVNLGMVSNSLGMHRQARQHLQQALAIHRESNNPFALAWGLTCLGEAACELGEYDEARAHFLEALQTAGESQTAPIALMALAGSARLFALKGDVERAVELLALVCRHPAAFRPTQDRARRLLAELRTPGYPAAELRGEALKLEAAVTQVLASLSALDMAANGYRATPELLDALTERELDVLRLIAAGLDTDQIADRLVITVGTVRNHIKSIYSKLDVHSRLQAVEQARRLNLL